MERDAYATQSDLLFTHLKHRHKTNIERSLQR